MWNVRVEMIGVSACRNVVVAGVRCAGGRKTWRECVKDDMVELGLHPEWAKFMGMKTHFFTLAYTTCRT